MWKQPDLRSSNRIYEKKSRENLDILLISLNNFIDKNTNILSDFKGGIVYYIPEAAGIFRKMLCTKTLPHPPPPPKKKKKKKKKKNHLKIVPRPMAVIIFKMHPSPLPLLDQVFR